MVLWKTGDDNVSIQGNEKEKNHDVFKNTIGIIGGSTRGNLSRNIKNL